MLDDFQFDDFDEEDDGGDEFGSPEESGNNNRTFLYVAGGLGAITVIGLILIAVWGFLRPGQGGTTADESANQTRVAQNATNEAQNAAIGEALTETAAAAFWTPTATLTLMPTDTPLPATATSTLIAGAVSVTPGGPTATGDGKGGGAFAPTTDPRTATVEALLTQASVAQTQAAATLEVLPTSTPVTALPDTGFLDDFGAAGLTAMAALMIVLIFAARRLRDANA